MVQTVVLLDYSWPKSQYNARTAWVPSFQRSPYEDLMPRINTTKYARYSIFTKVGSAAAAASVVMALRRPDHEAPSQANGKKEKIKKT